MDQQPWNAAQPLHGRQHSMGHSHNLWVDGKWPIELLEFQLPSNKTEQERRMLASYTPNMAHHSEPMVEVHSRPTTPSSPRLKYSEHLKGALAIQPLRNIAGPNRKWTSSSGNLPMKVSDRWDNESPNTWGSPTAKAYPNSNLHGELHFGDNHEIDIVATARACHYSSAESNDVHKGSEAGGMEMDDI